MDGKLGQSINVKFPETNNCAIVMRECLYSQEMHTEVVWNKKTCMGLPWRSSG